jgi:hypothetical protein
MTFPSAMVQAARDRAHKLDDDARAAVRELLDRRVKTDDAELARWARDHEDAGGLRDRWARELVAAAAEATAPVWAEVDAYNARWFIREARRYDEWAETGAPWDDPGLRLHPERLAKWRARADDDRSSASMAAAAAVLAGYTRTMPGAPDLDALDDEEGPETIYGVVNENGRLWAVSVVLSSPVLTPETRADVWAKLDAETARREGDEARVAEVEASPNEWAPCFLSSAPWEWLGGTYDQPEPDEGPVPDGFEAVARWREGASWWRVIRPAGPPRYLRAFTRDLWRARWHGEAVDGRKLAGRVLALTTRTAALVAAVLSPATVVQHHDDRIELVGTDGRTVGRMEHEHVSAMLTSWRGPVVDASMVRANADRLVENARTAAGVAGIWHGLHTATSRARRGLDLRAEWSSWSSWADEVAALAELKLDPNLRRLLCDFAWYGNTIQLRLFDGRWGKGLWSLVAPDPHKRGRPAAGEARAVEFFYNGVLDPGWARRENPTDRNRGVHLLGLPDRLPVHVADRAAKARAQVYTLFLLVEVCERSDHEHVADGAEVSAADRLALAARSGLHHDHEPVQLRGLLDDGLLVEVRGGRNRYALGDEKARALRSHIRPTPPHQRGRR